MLEASVSHAAGAAPFGAAVVRTPVRDDRTHAVQGRFDPGGTLPRALEKDPGETAHDSGPEGHSSPVGGEPGGQDCLWARDSATIPTSRIWRLATRKITVVVEMIG